MVCGDRYWKDENAIRRVLKSIPNIEVVIEGEAIGADTIAKKVAKELGIPVLKFSADWGSHGNFAGPLRNRRMLDEGKPTRVLAFHNNISRSRGTKDMVNQARARGIPVKIYPQRAG